MTDFDIIARIKEGDRNAYSLLVERYQNYVFTLAFRMLNSREDAEEVAQDCFVQAFMKLHTFRGQSKFSTWLYTIARRKSLNLLRKRKMPFRSMEEEIAVTDDGHSKLEEEEKYQAIARAMQALMPEDRTLLTLYYEYEQSIAEISSIMNEREGNIKVKLYRARKKLRMIIASQYPL